MGNEAHEEHLWHEASEPHLEPDIPQSGPELGI